jgi:hypothetical protein
MPTTTGGSPAKKLFHLAAPQLPAHNDLSRCIDAVNLEHVLR